MLPKLTTPEARLERFQFSLRALPVIVAFCLLACGLLAEKVQPAKQQTRLAAVVYEKGQSCIDRGDYDSAIAALDQAIRVDPRFAPAYRARGFAHVKKNDNDKAIADFTEAIRLKPNDEDAYRCRGRAYEQSGDPRHALYDYYRALHLYKVRQRSKGA
jgi:Tfp pilus assembly protein PilF